MGNTIREKQTFQRMKSQRIWIFHNLQEIILSKYSENWEKCLYQRDQYWMAVIFRQHFLQKRQLQISLHGPKNAYISQLYPQMQVKLYHARGKKSYSNRGALVNSAERCQTTFWMYDDSKSKRAEVLNRPAGRALSKEEVTQHIGKHPCFSFFQTFCWHLIQN